MTWTAGTSRIDITPPLGYRLQGHAARTKPAARIHDPLCAKALTLCDGERRVAIVTLDLVLLTPRLYDRLRGAVQARHGVPSHALVLACSHTHTGPFMRPPSKHPEHYLEDYVSLLEKKIVGAVGEAILNERPCTLAHASGEVDIGVINRRLSIDGQIEMEPNPEGPVDLTCPVIRVSDESGAPIAVLFQYACHPTTLSTSIDAVSADYPGVAQRQVEAAYPGAAAMFLNGCCGEIRPRVVNDQGRFGNGGFDDIRRMGEALAAHVTVCMERATPMREPTLHSTIARHRYRFDPQLMPEDDEKLERCQRILGQRNASEQQAIVEWSQRWRDALARGEAFSEGVHRDGVDGDIQAIRIGDVVLTALTGEVMVDVARTLRERVDVPMMIAGYAQGAIGYIPTRQAIQEGGYETRSFLSHDYPAPFADSVAEELIDHVQSLVHECLDAEPAAPSR